MLADGEDFELILAVAQGEADKLLAQQLLGVRLTQIGRFIAEAGLFSLADDGNAEPLGAAATNIASTHDRVRL